MGIKVDRLTNEEITSWNKNIEFTYDNEGYSVVLNHNNDYGYTILNWTNNMGHQIAPPEWSKEYKSDDEYLNMDNPYSALCVDLDRLSNEVDGWTP